jgi:fatty-acyl-CoA synthase
LRAAALSRHGGLCGVGAALLRGGTVVLRRKFSITHFWDDIVDHDCTMFVYIGELCRYLVNQEPGTQKIARTACGSPSAMACGPKSGTEFQARFAVPRILEFYGSTEGNVSMFNFDGAPGAIGRVPPYLQRNFAVRLVKFDIEAETPVRDDERLCASCAGRARRSGRPHQERRRHNYTGYADKAASERKILRDVVEKGDAWFRTGDLMRQDKDGYFYSSIASATPSAGKARTSRRPKWRKSIARYPGVDEVNVYGVKIDKLDGRAGMAAITPGEEFKLDGLRDYHGARTAELCATDCSYAFTPAIETTGTFKYRKVDLVREGFDPAKIEHDALFRRSGEQAPYVDHGGALCTHSERRVQALALEASGKVSPSIRSSRALRP